MRGEETCPSPADASTTVERLRELLAKASTPNPFDWHFPWRVLPDGGKPIIAGARSGNLFRGFIGTWQEADLVVGAVNALPVLLDLAEQALSAAPPTEDVLSAAIAAIVREPGGELLDKLLRIGDLVGVPRPPQHVSPIRMNEDVA